MYKQIHYKGITWAYTKFTYLLHRLHKLLQILIQNIWNLFSLCFYKQQTFDDDDANGDNQDDVSIRPDVKYNLLLIRLKITFYKLVNILRK